MRLRDRLPASALLSGAAAVALGCSAEHLDPVEQVVHLASADTRVDVVLIPFELRLSSASARVLTSVGDGDATAYGGLTATVDQPTFPSAVLPGWDTYVAGEQPWRHAQRAR